MPNYHSKENLTLLDKFVTKHNVIVLSHSLVVIAGDHASAAVLSQIIYWNSAKEGANTPRLQVVKDSELWLAKSYSDWRYECFVSEHQARRCIANLKQAGIIDTKVFKFNNSPTVHIRLLFSRLRELRGLYESLCQKYIDENKPIEEMAPEEFWDAVKQTSENHDSDLAKNPDGFRSAEKPRLNCAKTQIKLRENADLITETTTEITTEVKNYNKKVGLRPKSGAVAPDEFLDDEDRLEEELAALEDTTLPQQSGKPRNPNVSADSSSAPQATAVVQTSLGLDGETEPPGDTGVNEKGGKVANMDLIREVFEYWMAVNGSTKHRLTLQRINKIRARLKTYTVEELKQAIDGAKANPWYNGNNSRGTVYNRVETIFRDDTTTENHLTYEPPANQREAVMAKGVFNREDPNREYRGRRL